MRYMCYVLKYILTAQNILSNKVKYLVRMRNVYRIRSINILMVFCDADVILIIHNEYKLQRLIRSLNAKVNNVA